MNRSAGVTISAVVVLLGSGLVLLTGVMMLFASTSGVSVPQNQVRFFKYFMMITAVLLFAAGAWGISTGMALLRLREWSRVSMMVFGALLVFLSIPGLLMFLMVPFPPPGTAVSPQLTPSLLTGMRIFFTLFYAALAVLGAWWLYFFNKRSTKEQFLKVPGASPQPISDDSMMGSRARPLSITLIAWYLLISAFLGVLGLSVNPPVFFFGVLFQGNFRLADYVCAGAGSVPDSVWIAETQALGTHAGDLLLSIPDIQLADDGADSGDAGAVRSSHGRYDARHARSVEPGASDALSDLVWSDFRSAAAGAAALGGGQQERRLPGVNDAVGARISC